MTCKHSWRTIYRGLLGWCEECERCGKAVSGTNDKEHPDEKDSNK